MIFDLLNNTFLHWPPTLHICRVETHTMLSHILTLQYKHFPTSQDPLLFVFLIRAKSANDPIGWVGWSLSNYGIARFSHKRGDIMILPRHATREGTLWFSHGMPQENEHYDSPMACQKGRNITILPQHTMRERERTLKSSHGIPQEKEHWVPA